MKKSQDNNSHPTHRTDGYDTVGSIETNTADGFTMVAVGDLIVSRPLTKGDHPGFDDIVKILSDADATFGNMETLSREARRLSTAVRITSVWRS